MEDDLIVLRAIDSVNKIRMGVIALEYVADSMATTDIESALSFIAIGINTHIAEIKKALAELQAGAEGSGGSE